MRLESLEPGDVECNQCHGTGEPGNNKITVKDKLGLVPWYCDKCHGTGKLDWIENVTGKRPRMLTANWNVDFSTAVQLYGPKSADFDKAIDNIAKKMAEDIDKQILEGITNGTGTWRSGL